MRRPRRATVARAAAAAASGLLLAISRPPLDFGPLACVALVPLFVVWHDRRPRACAGYGFLAGAVYYSITCSWIYYFGAAAVIPFVAATAGYWALAGVTVGWLRTQRIASPWITAAVWIIADALVARFPLGGLSWGEIGYAFHNVEPARALASVGGLALVSYAAIAINAFVADLVVGPRDFRPQLRAGLGIVIVLAVALAATVTRAEPHVIATLRVALVQGNDKDRELTDAELAARYLPNSHFDLAKRITDPVDFIVFPESSMDADPRTDAFIHDHLAMIARLHHAWVLANATVDAPARGHEPAGARALNLDVMFNPDGSIQGTYAKRHLVPFGEYVPFRRFLQSWITELNKVPRDFERGSSPGLFTVDGTQVATVICFESAFGYQVRPLVRDGAGMIVVSTNNRSYRRSGNAAQHLAIGQMRAAETGRPVLQSAISGISAVIDADGNVHDRTHLFDRSLVETTVDATSGETPYVRYGEWATVAAILVVGAALIVAVIRRRRQRSVESLTPHEMVSIESRIDGYEVPTDAAEHDGETSSGDSQPADHDDRPPAPTA